MFYISDDLVIDELLKASKRGVAIQIILDPNKDAFGRQKNGIPNRQVAHILTSKSNGSIKIRWCMTHGEQCHGKLLIVQQEHLYTMLLGSANYTRRNIGGYNLETDVMAQSKDPFTAWSDAERYFEKLWSNDGLIFSGDYETYQDTSRFKRWVAYIMEHTGLGTF
jgi:phosphatidylserine/phosphatidylglycerophosphate/cardiolipin synthase-like enzyme